MPLPDPPENVRAVFPDGHEYPLELAYMGYGANGVHRWVATVPIRVQERGAKFSIRCAVLPAHTSISVFMEIPAGLAPYVGDLSGEGEPPWRRAPGN